MTSFPQKTFPQKINATKFYVGIGTLYGQADSPSISLQPHFSPSDRLTIFPSHQSSKLQAHSKSFRPSSTTINMSTEVSTNEDRKVALVTGITGQDGSYLTELLLEKGYTVSLFVMDHPRSEMNEGRKECPFLLYMMCCCAFDYTFEAARSLACLALWHMGKRNECPKAPFLEFNWTLQLRHAIIGIAHGQFQQLQWRK